MIRGELAVDASLDSVDFADPSFHLQVPTGTDPQTSQRLAAVLAETRKYVEAVLGLQVVRTVNVRVFPSQDFYRISQLPEWAVGSFDGKIRLKVEDIAGDGRHLANLLAHELAHAIIGGHMQAEVPAWFHEGIAQLCEPYAEESTRGAAFRNRKLLAILRDSKPVLGQQVSFKELTQREDADTAYLIAKSFVGYLVQVRGDEVLRQLIRELRGTDSFETQFQKVYGRSLLAMETEWRESMSQGTAPRPRGANPSPQR
jgi:hypothetical protein